MGALAFVITLVLGYPFVEYLRRAGLGKKVRIEGPSTHLEKTGTPTMGGILIVFSVLALTIALSLTLYRENGRSILLPLAVMAATAVLGWIDDRMSLVGSSGAGMSARSKFALLFLVALLAAVVLWNNPLSSPLPYGLGINYLFVPGIKNEIAIGWLIVPLACFGIMGTAHAVNLTDGLDSLAGHTAAVAFAAYGIIAQLYGQTYLVTFCFAVSGVLLGFLWFNAHPAEVFMGDTGALSLGATLAIVALMLGQVLLLAVIGFVFVAETLSVILQVGYFKLSRGKRLFRMAPLHNHFELMGWSQTQVAQRFWLVSMVTALLGVALALV
ncbi:MAG: phospho-N-acetylmuramoyl-pentapeptide-transferase [Chloroflexi bacterium]|nr:phospho-N-acetylmuramoyl-pentapeptide-transferase [Chloroflexota bacterium]